MVFGLAIETLACDLNIDDSYYYYGIARNFAHGLFSTFDGVNLTNGYQPLWAWILTPVFVVLTEPVAALRASKILEFSFLVAASWFALSAARTAGWNLIATSMVPLWLFGKRVFFIGMEASTAVLMLTALAFLLTRIFVNPFRRIAWYALFLECVLFPWVRLEFIAVALLAATMVTLYALLQKERLAQRILAIWAAGIISSLLYLTYNELVFGTMVPVSGQIKNYWSTIRFAQDGGYDFVQNAWNFAASQWMPELASILAFIGIVLSWLIPVYRQRLFAANHAMDAFLLILFGAYSSRLLFSVLNLHIVYDVPWYYVPGQLLAMFVLPLLVSRMFLLADVAAPAFAKRWHQLEIGVGALVLISAITLLNPWSVATGLLRSPSRPDWQIASFHGVEWMNKNLPADTVIGSPDSGIIGYFSRHRVINLDGLANSNEFFTAMKLQLVEAWMRREGVTHLAGGMRADAAEGCGYMAIASVQRQPYAGPCMLLHEGDSFEALFGSLSAMRFRVYAFGGANTQLKRATAAVRGVRND